MSPAAIQEKLEAFAKTQDVRILFAVESGSRAWGFASPDSDYDVRAVFVRPLEDYLTVSERSEDCSTIDGDFDLGAWDLRKFLRLVRKSNATPSEWLQSPIRYHGEDSVFDELLALCGAHFQPRGALNHYRGLARKSWLSFDERGYGRLKKLFYVLRPLLAARWVADRATIPPMQFAPLLEMLPDAALREAINLLVLRKTEVGEGHEEIVPAPVQEYIRDTFSYLESRELPKPEPSDSADLDAYFRSTVHRFTP